MIGVTVVEGCLTGTVADEPLSPDLSDGTAEPAESELYTLSELARSAGVTERTIRYYQSQKLIPRPDKKGREAWYRPEHLERIRLIVDLRDRGLSLAVIRDLVDDDDPTTTVENWLGIDAALRAPWSDDRPSTVGEAELRELVAEHPRGTLGELIAEDFVRDNRDGTWTIVSPTLTDQALRLLGAGIDVDVSAAIRDLLRRRMAKAVHDTVKLMVKRAGEGFAADGGADQFSSALGALRPVAREMASLILAQEVERALAHLAEDRPREIRGVSSRSGS